MKGSGVPGAVMWRVVFQCPGMLWPLVNFTALEIERSEAHLSLRVLLLNVFLRYLGILLMTCDGKRSIF